MKYRRSSVVLLAALAMTTAAAAQGPLSYTYLDLEYGMDSTIQIYGGAFDSDDSYVVGGSWRFSKRFFLWGRFGEAGYDLRGNNEHYSLTEGTLGLGYRVPLRRDADSPLDFISSLSYEYHDMGMTTAIAEETFNSGGVGLRVGVRAGITRHFELNGYVYWRGYGSDPLSLPDGLDGLFFELGTALKVLPRLDLTLTFLTGELDYVELTPVERPDQVEVDRDELRVGVRFIF
jgi:hypothetical protein